MKIISFIVFLVSLVFLYFLAKPIYDRNIEQTVGFISHVKMVGERLYDLGDSDCAEELFSWSGAVSGQWLHDITFDQIRMDERGIVIFSTEKHSACEGSATAELRMYIDGTYYLYLSVNGTLYGGVGDQYYEHVAPIRESPQETGPS